LGWIMDEHENVQEAQGSEQTAADDTTPETPTANAEAPDTQSLEAPVNPLAAGQIVEGLIVHIDEQGALVDVGT